MNQRYFVDDYTSVVTVKDGMSKMGYSFVIGIIAVILSYLLAVPLGILMALLGGPAFVILLLKPRGGDVND